MDQSAEYEEQPSLLLPPSPSSLVLPALQLLRPLLPVPRPRRLRLPPASPKSTLLPSPLPVTSPPLLPRLLPLPLLLRLPLHPQLSPSPRVPAADLPMEDGQTQVTSTDSPGLMAIGPPQVQATISETILVRGHRGTTPGHLGLSVREIP
jgi:hypothetical protein